MVKLLAALLQINVYDINSHRQAWVSPSLFFRFGGCPAPARRGEKTQFYFLPIFGALNARFTDCGCSRQFTGQNCYHINPPSALFCRKQKKNKANEKHP
jgi:hypothetical protein